MAFQPLNQVNTRFSAQAVVTNHGVWKRIPEHEIAFIQDFESDVGKESLFRRVREGKVRVLFGSTAKMIRESVAAKYARAIWMLMAG